MTTENMSDVPSTNEPNAEAVNPAVIRKSTTQSLLKAASAAAGMEFDSVETLAATLARLSATAQQTSTPTVQQNVEPAIKRTTTNDLQEQFVALRQDLAKKEQILREKELDTDIRSAMGSKFDEDLMELALSKVRANIQWDVDGTYQIVNSKGQVRYGEDGNPLTINGIVNEVAKSNPKLLKMAATNSGSGLRPSEGMYGAPSEVVPDYTSDPAAFNAWAQRNGLGKGVGLKGVKAQVYNSSQVNKIL